MHILFLIAVVSGLVIFSALCSGLNIALMSLDLADLRRKAKLGNVHARRVLPLRKKMHLVLAGILLTNVATVSATSLFLESAFNGWIAGIASTLLIVIFGEILPQAVFARRALVFCSRLAPLLQFMVICTYPISKPLQLLLDRLFSQESVALQSRHELGIMISEHVGNDQSELDNDEVEIIRGALQLSEKRARDIMQPISAVYWLTPDTILSPAKIDELKDMGWSRIPIFNRRQTTCFGILLMKDLVDVDFDKEQLRVDDMPLYPTHMIGSMTALDTLFRKFISGGAHLVPIERDDVIVGIATIEDLLEEIVGHEIEDETDRAKQRPSAAVGKNIVSQ
jgi:CBS domain containing-hemolysin-like protein